MGDTDKHPAIADLRTRMIRVEEKLTNAQTVMTDSIALVTKEINGVIHEIDRRALEQERAESTWKTEHALAVNACKAHGEMAVQAMSLARSAHKVATNANAPAGSKRTERMSIGALIGALIALLSALTAWLSRGGS